MELLDFIHRKGEITMKNKSAILILLAVAILVGGMIFGIEYRKHNAVVKVEETDSGILYTYEDGTGYYQEIANTTYTAYGRYYTDGTVTTNDGNDSMWWEYSTDSISNQTPYDGMPVWVAFDDNGTPDDITDDIILGLVYDRETAIYDDLETALSDKFELERDGNNIRIKEAQ